MTGSTPAVSGLGESADGAHIGPGPVDTALSDLGGVARPSLQPPPPRTREPVPAGLSVVPSARHGSSVPAAVSAAQKTRSSRSRGSRLPELEQEQSADQASTVFRPLSVRIPVALKLRLDADLGAEGLTQTERVVQAFNSQANRLSELFAEFVEASGPMPVVRSTRRRRTSAGPSELVRLRLTEQQYTVLEELVHRFNTNRTLLVTRVLDADLPEVAS